uniref:Protein trichome birefringence-like 2 n=1 Tax=Noccaea caerulescens TaxID=107243 RepID=A0A1J3FYH3_NOCCA
MESSKKLPFPDQILSSRRRNIVTRFSLGIAASLVLLLTLLSLTNSSFSVPFVSPLLQGLKSSNLNTSSSVTQVDEKREVVNLTDQVPDVKVPSFVPTEQRSGETGDGDSKNATSSGEGKASSFDSGQRSGERAEKNSSSAEEDKVLVANDQNTLEANATITVGNNSSSLVSDFVPSSVEVDRSRGSYEDCDIYDGNWVRADDDDDETMPYYPPGSCPYIDRDFNCHANGRPDDAFVKWKWQPNKCDIPRLNGTDFLEKLRGKKLVFVGDSINRNMWESLVCILRHSIKNKKRVYEISGKSEFKKRGVYAFRFEDYNCTVDFVGSPFLVRESSFKGENGTKLETLRLDLMDKTTPMYRDADILVFNTGHWWTHDKIKLGENYYQEGNVVYPRLKVLEAYKRALTTWSKWVDKNINRDQTHVVFRGYSVTHFRCFVCRGGPWNSGGQCHNEAEPIFNTSYLKKYPSKMRAVEKILHDTMKTPVIYMNISRLTDFRKDGHPSIYRTVYRTEKEKREAVSHQDCSHWCLPGVPDTWNQLLYVSLLKAGLASKW